jgi:phosphoglycerol transferase MdoB-like AlkP superfamily enzyme
MQYYNQVIDIYPHLPSEEQVYLAKIMDFDRSLEYLIYDFEHTNKLDDLVIIIYGDHHPKEIFKDKTAFYDVCDSKGYDTVNCFQTPFIIWDNSNLSQTIQKVSNPLDISPTIYDLFNLDYDKATILGKSIFDPTYEGYYFDEFGIIETDNFIYDSINHTIVSLNKTEDDTNVIKAQALYQKMQILRKLVDINYFKELDSVSE